MAYPCEVIDADILNICAQPAQPEIEQRVLLIPSTLLPVFTYDVTLTNALITDITLGSGAGVILEGILNKNWIQDGFEYMNPNDLTAGFKHLINGIKVLNPSAATRAEVNAMAVGGGTYVAIVESKWKGVASADAFKVLGAKHGLVIPDGGITFNSNENDGTMVISLATRDGLKEPYLPAVFLDTNYATTATAVWTNKLAAA